MVEHDEILSNVTQMIIQNWHIFLSSSPWSPGFSSFFFSSPSNSKTYRRHRQWQEAAEQSRDESMWSKKLILTHILTTHEYTHSLDWFVRGDSFGWKKIQSVSKELKKSLNSKHFTRNHQQFPVNLRSEYAASEWERTKTWRKKTQTKIIPRMDWMINDATEFALIMKRY